jgi:hypothetical protein
LLILQATIERQENLKTCFLSKREQFSILLARKVLVRDRAAVMTGQPVPEFSGDALVE